MHDRFQSLYMELVKHDDCTHCAIDNLIRPSRRIAGQQDYLVGEKKRNEAPIPDSEAIRGITNMASRTGALIVCAPANSENAETLKNLLLKKLPFEVRNQIRTVAHDKASFKFQE